MRQGQQNRRGRGRSNTNNNNNNSNNTINSHSNNGRKPQNSLARNYESSGPDVKIRGTAAQVAEKYMTLARDAHASGDPVLAENYLQHAEHYNRIIMAAQQAQVAPFTQPQTNPGGEQVPGFNGQHRPQPDSPPQPFMRDQPQPVIDQPHVAPPVRGMEPQPELSQEALDDAAAAEIDETQAQARDDNTRRRRRRYPAGGAPNRAAAAAPAATDPANANGHNGPGNGVDGPSGPPDEVLAN